MMDALIFAAAVAAGPTTAGTATSAVVAAARIPTSWQPFASCVARRESNYNPKAVNRSSGAAGKWQFLPAWRNGLPYMVAGRLKANGMPKDQARALRIRLQATPINKWAEEHQDVGFVAALLAPEGRGWRHWSLPGSRCEGLVPR
jgi:hypothetical protein